VCEPVGALVELVVTRRSTTTAQAREEEVELEVGEPQSGSVRAVAAVPSRQRTRREVAEDRPAAGGPGDAGRPTTWAGPRWRTFLAGGGPTDRRPAAGARLAAKAKQAPTARTGDSPAGAVGENMSFSLDISFKKNWC
jgi:hypothetical protein